MRGCGGAVPRAERVLSALEAPIRCVLALVLSPLCGSSGRGEGAAGSRGFDAVLLRCKGVTALCCVWSCVY